MQVDFYQLSRDPAEAVVPLIADKTLATGERLLVSSADQAQLTRISSALWAREGTFLAHGTADAPHRQSQPILLSDTLSAENGARYLLLADGVWRAGAEAFDRVFLLFGQDTIESARTVWRSLDDAKANRNFWRQEAGKWIKAA